MTDAQTPPADGANNGNPPDGANPSTPQDGDKSNMIPYSRFQEVINQKNALDKQLQEIEDARKKAEADKLEEEGKYKELLEKERAEKEALSAKATEWDNFQATRKDEILAGWSDDQKENFGDLPLTKLEALNKQFKLEQGGGKAPQDRPGTSKTGQKYNGHSSLKEWAVKDKESFRKRNGDYPG